MSDQNSLSSGPRPLSVLITMDVEEEGLFSGQYRRRNPGVTNIASLPKLARLSDELGFPLTLLCSHAVFTDAAACRVVEEMRDRHGAEVGAHLHHWSTPPFESAEEFCQGQPPRTDKIDRGLLSARLESLLAAGEAFQGAPLTSFRMGRWDLKNVLFPMLSEHGILADSSICPLRAYKAGADHFLAPNQPYWALGRETPFLEIPITQIPLLECLPGLWQKLFADSPRRDSFHFLAALSGSPFWHGDAVMRLCVRLLRLRRSDVLCVFWHSTEIVAKGSPHVPDEKAVEKVLGRIFSFFTWLRESVPCRGMTMTGLYREARAAEDAGVSRYPDRAELAPLPGDW
ncbi:MAG: hypothetical protein Q4F72_08625 [Desulfovibrionaceae bacterium]|nr:hypothetical protein [Desulfovibrionaceae bacterium]